ncbi:TPA: conserved phage C-terminal domain-containing protein [Aeromonas salmonicida]|nr:conserved phage C-terminal domain-containing protein [Aeromonas salmonicida]
MSTVLKFPGAVAPISKPISRGSSVSENARNGFRLAYSSMLNAPWYKDVAKKSVWLHLLLDAAYESREVIFNGNRLTIHRGQLACSARSLGKACGVSEDQARRALDYFEAEGGIGRTTKQGKSGYTIISLLNFDAYQRGVSQHFSAEYGAEFEGAPDMVLEDDRQLSGAELGAEYHAEDLIINNNINSEGNKQISCSVSDETKPTKKTAEPSADSLAVLNHLNAACNRRYQAKPTTLQNINARLAEGYSVADLQLVTDFKREHWSANLKMAEYLRPMTLFAPQKFAGYLAGAQRWEQIGRPRCVNGEWEGFEGKRKPMSNIAAAQKQAKALLESGAVSYDDNTPL